MVIIYFGPMGKQLLKTPPAMGILIVLQTGHPSEPPLNQNEGFIAGLISGEDRAQWVSHTFVI